MWMRKIAVAVVASSVKQLAASEPCPAQAKARTSESQITTDQGRKRQEAVAWRRIGLAAN